VIPVVDCPNCGLQIDLHTPGPEGIEKLPPNLYLDSLLTALQQDFVYRLADQNQDERCSKCQTIGSASLCEHCRQVSLRSKWKFIRTGHKTFIL
jgi:hypothetical protein